MIRQGNDAMRRFSVDVELANYDDLVLADAGAISHADVRKLTLRGVVDTGATRLVLPQAIAERLGLKLSGSAVVRYADGHFAQRGMVGGIHLMYGGRSSVFNAIVEPDRDSALIGAIVLNDLDFVVDGNRQTLSPRDPDRIISEVE